MLNLSVTRLSRKYEAWTKVVDSSSGESIKSLVLFLLLHIVLTSPIPFCIPSFFFISVVDKFVFIFRLLLTIFFSFFWCCWQICFHFSVANLGTVTMVGLEHRRNIFLIGFCRQSSVIPILRCAVLLWHCFFLRRGQHWSTRPKVVDPANVSCAIGGIGTLRQQERGFEKLFSIFSLGVVDVTLFSQSATAVNFSSLVACRLSLGACRFISGLHGGFRNWHHHDRLGLLMRPQRNDLGEGPPPWKIKHWEQ